MIDICAGEKFLAAMSVTLGQGHAASIAVKILTCTHSIVKNTHCVTIKFGRYIPLVISLNCTFWVNSVWKLFTPQPSGLEGYCCHGPGGRAGGCQTCGTHISVTGWRIFSIPSSVELSFTHLLHMGLPMGQKLVKFATNWVQTLRIAYLWNRGMDVPHLKFHGLV